VDAIVLRAVAGKNIVSVFKEVRNVIKHVIVEDV